jgi:D-arabinose 1-dehydrogenase-like Zn-dependent alcohol dehydrogenase
MRAALLTELRKPLTVTGVEDPEIDKDEVLIETHFCGICRTDLHIQDGLAYVPSLPHIPGHEPAGVVARVGTGVHGVAPGDRVVPHLFLACQACRYCRTGNHAQCRRVRGIIGVTRPGGFAEYFKAPASCLLKVPENVKLNEAGLVSCAMVTAVRALRRSRLAFGESAVVIGAGGIGLILIQMLKAFGIRAAAIAGSEQSRSLASEMGAGIALLASDSELPRKIASVAADEEEGVDCAFDLVGSAQTMRLAAASVARQGRIVVVGEEAESAPLQSIEIAQRELEIIGARNGGMQDAADAMAMLSKGIVKPAIAARFPLDQINDAFNLVRGGSVTGRVMISMR